MQMTRKALAIGLLGLLVAANAQAATVTTPPNITVNNQSSTDLVLQIANGFYTTLSPGGSYSWSAGDGCTAAAASGHYTQVVWAKTRFIGCDFKQCGRETRTGYNWANLNLTCNYYPPGDFGGKTPPYQPAVDPKSGDIDMTITDRETIQNGLCTGCQSPDYETKSTH